MTDDSESEFTANRRNVLKSTGAFAGVNLLDIQPPEDPSGHEFRLVETGYEYNVTDPSLSDSFLPIIHLDFSPHYHIDHDRKALLVNPHANLPEDIPSVLKNRDFVVRAREYHAPGSSLFDGRIKELAYNMENDFRRTYTLRLRESVTLPRITVHRDGEDAVVMGNGVDLRVPPGGDVRTELEQMEVPVETLEVTDTKVQDDSIPEFRRPLRKEREETTVSVVPELRVRNNGKLSLYEGKPA